VKLCVCVCFFYFFAGVAGRKRGPRPVFATFGDAIVDARSRVVLEAEADEDDFGGMSANKTTSVRAQRRLHTLALLTITPSSCHPAAQCASVPC
jgi:hypothetical protein